MIDVDGETDLFGQYGSTVGQTVFGTFSWSQKRRLHDSSGGSGGGGDANDSFPGVGYVGASTLGVDAATSVSEDTNDTGGALVGSTSANTSRRLSYTFTVVLKIIMPQRTPAEWKVSVDLIIARLRANIISGWFAKFLQESLNEGYGHDEYDGHWTNTRRLALSGSSPDTSYGTDGVLLGDYIAENIYGNSPSGMPTSAPTTAVPLP